MPHSQLFLLSVLLCSITWLAADPGWRVYGQEAVPVFSEFPGDPESWRVSGNAGNAKIDETGVAIFSAVPERVRVVRDFSIDQDLIDQEGGASGIRLLSVEARISPIDTPVDLTFDTIASRFHVQKRNTGTDKNHGLLAKRQFPTAGDTSFRARMEVLLDQLADESGSMHVESISPLSSEIDMLRATMVLHASGAWKLEALSIQSSAMSPWYIATMAVLLCMWVVLLASLVKQLKLFHRPQKAVVWIVVASATLVFALVPFPLNLMIANVMGEEPKVIHALFRDSVVLSMLFSPHFLVHALMSLFLLIRRHIEPIRLSTVFMSNLALALAVESWQAHSYTRSAQWTDVGTGMMGAAVAVVLYCCVSVMARKRQVKYCSSRAGG